MSDVTLDDQAARAAEFLRALLAAMGLEATVTAEGVEDDTLEVVIAGESLGLLIGPRRATLNALEELVRAVVQRETGGQAARVHVDVNGYRARRKVALESFARRLATEVRETGEECVLEPMSSPDRKVVHDVVAELDGVETVSEGEDPRRYVVIRAV